MPRVPDEWFVVDVEAKVRLKRHTELNVLILDVEVEDLGVILSFNVSDSWAEDLFRATAEHLALPPVEPGLRDDDVSLSGTPSPPTCPRKKDESDPPNL